MENSYSQFYNKLYTGDLNEKSIKKHEHQKLSPNYIQKVIKAILTKNQALHQHEKLIRSTFGFDTPLISLNNLFSEYKLDETEFNEIIRKFIKSIYYSIYFRVNIYRVFLIFVIGFFIIAGINSLFYELNYFSIVTSNIVRYFIPVSIFVVLIPFIVFSKSRVESRTRNILKQYK